MTGFLGAIGRVAKIKVYFVVLLALAAVVVGCGAESATGNASGPGGTVRNYFDALSSGDSKMLATLFIPEINEGLADAALPQITITNLVVDVESESADGAQVVAEYDVDFPEVAQVRLRLIVENRQGEWLISRTETVGI